ncbi:hypothetical protein [Streptomyces sp. NPDC127119]
MPGRVPPMLPDSPVIGLRSPGSRPTGTLFEVTPYRRSLVLDQT